jgi:hypothetical protein
MKESQDTSSAEFYAFLDTVYYSSPEHLVEDLEAK